MDKIITKEQIARLETMFKSLSKEDLDCVVAMGADTYSQGLLHGSLVTLGFAAVPAVIYLLNRIFRK